MKKNLLLTVFLILFLFPGILLATPDSIGVSKVGGKNYIIHKVETSESWYSIAHIYGVSYAELRLANKDSSDLLVPGKLILVPAEKLKSTDPFFEKNYVQNQEEQIHIVKAGETLFSIAKQYSTSVDSLKKWNKLTDGHIKTGQKIKVGMKTGKVEKAKPDSASIVKHTSSDVPVTDTSKKIEADKSTEMVADSTKIIKTASGVKTDSKKSPSTLSAKGRKEITETGIASWIRDDDINPNKYYALHRSAPIGTIIRVTNKMNGKYVFVKVVGTLPDTGDNNDLLIKISKASAEKLGVRDSKFQSELSYGINEKK